MATVVAVFTRAPWIRTPEQVVESLFGRDPSPQNPPPPRPEHQRLWASLTQGKDTVMGEVAAEVLRRDPQGHKIQVALRDGERALPILVSKKLQVTLILDLLHVLEKLWKAAYVFQAEGSAEAEQWFASVPRRSCKGTSAKSCRAFVRRLPNSRSGAATARRWRVWPTTSIATAVACAMTNIWPKACPSPPVRWKVPART